MQQIAKVQIKAFSEIQLTLEFLNSLSLIKKFYPSLEREGMLIYSPSLKEGG